MSDTQYDPETLMTESSENRTVIMSENGCVSYEFTTPLVEGYGMATNPYREFRRGVDIKTFTSDTLPLTDATLRANYAIYYENQKLWEAKGNVVIYKFNRKGGRHDRRQPHRGLHAAAVLERQDQTDIL